MKNMRIAVISYHTCPLSDEKNAEVGGMNTYVLELSKALVKKGYVIDIYTRAVDKHAPAVVDVIPGLKVIHITDGNLIEIPKKELFKHLPQFLKNLKIYIDKQDLSYDLISAHYYLSGLIGLKLKKIISCPLFVTFHTLALMKNLVGKSMEEKEDLARIKSELYLTKKADKIIATSESDLEYIHTLYNCPLKKISLLNPGVNLTLFRPIKKSSAKKIIRANPNHKIILFVGRIEPLKGIDVLLYTIKILLQRKLKPIPCLWIVGANNIKNEKDWTKELRHLEGLRRLLEIRPYVKFVGRQSQLKLPYYYNSAEIVLMPSQYESFGIAALEAMACAVPVIVTDTAGVSGLLDKEHSSLLTSASNPIGLARKIKHLLTNKKEYDKMSKEVFNKVADLSWENVAEKFSQIFKQ